MFPYNTVQAVPLQPAALIDFTDSVLWECFQSAGVVWRFSWQWVLMQVPPFALWKAYVEQLLDIRKVKTLHSHNTGSRKMLHKRNRATVLVKPAYFTTDENTKLSNSPGKKGKPPSL